MHKTIKKAIAGISALAMTAAMSATTIPAFASEYEAIDAQEYVNSFENPETREVAQFYLDNGISGDELKDMMSTYEEGLALLNSEQTDESGIALTSANSSTTVSLGNGGNYYNGTRMANSKHYAVITNDRPKAHVVGNFIVSTSNAVSYDIATHPYTLQSGYENLGFSTSKNQQQLIIAGTLESDSESVEAIVTFPFTAGIATSEAKLRSGFTLSSNFNSMNGVDGSYSMNTYALGDLDHNGIVDSADYTLASRFLVSLINKVTFNYKDVGPGVASAIFILAFDVNMDGQIDLSDAVGINKIINA
ncbi:dockerin type I domain-containing protein [uncultured Ruminococcus sp.]|uniref:dockerin type I domain-containing protein n=1 Tax=uncultured Ruminococcus sp. TaxID=165186 RepID=UPI00267531AA|nr:dockerin type I domain-containing protein [uncultured Ruminococcus sp.]